MAGSVRAIAGLMAAAAVAAATALVADADRGSAPPVLRVYASLPLDRGGSDVDRAIRLALAERGGRAGRFAVEYVALDSMAGTKSFSRGRVEANARRAGRDPRAIAYLGELRSGALAYSIPLLNRAGLVQVSPTSTYAGLTRGRGAARLYPMSRRTFARVVPADHLQAAAAVAWMGQLDTSRLAVIRTGRPYEDDLARMVAGRARYAGLLVRTFRVRTGRLASIRDAANAAARSCADTAYFGGMWQSRAVALWGRLHRARPQLRLMGGDGLADRMFARAILRSARAKTYITRPTFPVGRRFHERFRAAYDKDPEPEAIYGYEAMRLVLDAVARRGGKRAAVVDAVFATRGRDSALGRYSIDRNGDTTLPRYGAYRVDPAGNLVFDRVLTGP